DMTVNGSPAIADIIGNVLFTSGLRTITVNNGAAFPNLEVLANVRDAGSGLQFIASSSGLALSLVGSNSFTGPLTISGTGFEVFAETPYALGATSGATFVQNGGILFVYSTG